MPNESYLYPMQIENVCYQYDEDDVAAVDHVSLNVEKGSFVAVLGHNGSGKSTLAKLMNALYLPTEGRVLVCGLDTAQDEEVWHVRRHAGMVFQNPDNQIVASVVEEDVAFGPENLGVPPAEIRQRVPFVLRLVGLMTKASCYPEELSGGEQQRVALARALTNNANLIIADEPTGNIDPTMSYEVVKLLTCLNEMGTTIVMVTHEHELVRAFDRRVITLGNGCIVGDTAAQAPQEPDVPQPIEPLSDAVQAGGAL